MPTPKRIAVFASGTGTNARNLISFFKKSSDAEVSLLVCNNPKAKVLEVAKELGVAEHLLDRESFYESTSVLRVLNGAQIDIIVLAGFLWLLPAYLIQAFPDRILNIHPALLPKYGGKGMYGQAVHQAVKDSGDVESGITVHIVNEQFDEGKIVFQARCVVDSSDSPDDIAAKVHALEMEHFPRVVRNYLDEGERPHPL